MFKVKSSFGVGPGTHVTALERVAHAQSKLCPCRARSRGVGDAKDDLDPGVSQGADLRLIASLLKLLAKYFIYLQFIASLLKLLAFYFIWTPVYSITSETVG
jgi:hypothetical protein